jgi:hypothetical protein
MPLRLIAVFRKRINRGGGCLPYEGILVDAGRFRLDNLDVIGEVAGILDVRPPNGRSS